MTISAARRRIIEVLESCQIDARTRSLLQKALAESWEVAPIRPPRENAPPVQTPQPGGALGSKRSVTLYER